MTGAAKNSMPLEQVSVENQSYGDEEEIIDATDDNSLQLTQDARSLRNPETNRSRVYQGMDSFNVAQINSNREKIAERILQSGKSKNSVNTVGFSNRSNTGNMMRSSNTTTGAHDYGR